MGIPQAVTDLWERHVVLMAPRIHWNTGNAGRTCLGTGSCLHLVKPLGFSLDSKQVKRAGLDYWPEVDLHIWESFNDLRRKYDLQPREVALFSKKGAQSFRNMPSCRRLFLIFGSETEGIDAGILGLYPGCVYHIPVNDRIRSLNLSTAVAVALYESLRAVPDFHGWQP
jgi:tRNA (cytidine/uridine-2'-O-)-methyltransferase